jgi:plasmid stability protein
MKNITVTLDDETSRRARIHAAAHDTSVSAMVKHFLGEVAGGESEPARLKKQETRVREAIRAFRAGDRLSRDEIYARDS